MSSVVLLAKNGFWIKHKNEFKHLNLKIEHETHKSVDVWTIIKNDFWNINRPNSKKKRNIFQMGELKCMKISTFLLYNHLFYLFLFT